MEKDLQRARAAVECVAMGNPINAMLGAAAMNFHKLPGAFWLHLLRTLLGAWGRFRIVLAPIDPQMCATSI